MYPESLKIFRLLNAGPRTRPQGDGKGTELVGGHLKQQTTISKSSSLGNNTFIMSFLAMPRAQLIAFHVPVERFLRPS